MHYKRERCKELRSILHNLVIQIDHHLQGYVIVAAKNYINIVVEYQAGPDHYQKKMELHIVWMLQILKQFKSMRMKHYEN